MAEIPDLIKLREIPADYAQRLDTDLLETSTFQEATATQPGFARFDRLGPSWHGCGQVVWALAAG